MSKSTEQDDHMSTLSQAYQFERPYVGRKEARSRLYGRLCLRYGIHIVNRHWPRVIAILGKAEDITAGHFAEGVVVEDKTWAHLTD